METWVVTLRMERTLEGVISPVGAANHGEAPEATAIWGMGIPPVEEALREAGLEELEV